MSVVSGPVCRFEKALVSFGSGVILHHFILVSALRSSPLPLLPSSINKYNVSVNISADIMQPTVRHSSVQALHVTRSPGGETLVTMADLYTGWFEIRNLVGHPGSKVDFQVSTTAGKALEFSMKDSFTFGPSGNRHTNQN